MFEHHYPSRPATDAPLSAQTSRSQTLLSVDLPHSASPGRSSSLFDGVVRSCIHKPHTPFSTGVQQSTEWRQEQASPH